MFGAARPLNRSEASNVTFSTLIQTEQLASNLGDPEWAIVDCRFYLANSDRGRQEYLVGHIPGAVYAHLDEDLCGPITPGITGRHPLPEISVITEKLSRWGIDATAQVIAYDDAGGSMAAARLWWMLRWLGHSKVAVLDGGWRKWKREGLPVLDGEVKRPIRVFQANIQANLRIQSDEIQACLGHPGFLLVDVRNADRYRGENETIDPVAGHIPGAINLPYIQNLDPRGRFLPPETLKNLFAQALEGIPTEEAIFYCGSGVTAAHSLLAMAQAGLGIAKLYDGSWSEWITDPNRPIVTGKE
jgi:thiosulfate/3-mercaptopyruvate sulfurtransferase